MTTIIIGAGASGLACAISLKQNKPECEVIILEQLSTAGKKILATGNGRCNLTNTKAEGYSQVISFFDKLGLMVKADDEGRVYPYSNQASTVLEILIDKCNELGIEIICDCKVEDVDKNLIINSDKGVFMADKIVIASGSVAQRALGSTGEGYEILKKLGHTICHLYPGLVQLISPNKYIKRLKGSRAKCNMSILIDDIEMGKEFGEVLFTDYGLSGIVTMNLSNIVSENFSSYNPKKCHAVLDLIPEMSVDEIHQYINMYKSLKGILGSKLNSILEKIAEYDYYKMAVYAKNWKIIINGTKGFDFAQITCGGVKENEFENYQSKIINGLYCCGEILNKQFPCGGYNLNHAWLSGIKTADEIAKLI